MGNSNSLFCDCSDPDNRTRPESQPQPTRRSTSSSALDEFEIKGQIGAGGFGRILLVELRQNISRGIRQYYALKCISKRKMAEQGLEENVMFEYALLAKHMSPFIIGLKRAFQDSSKCYLLLEYAEGGDLYTFIQNPRKPQKTERLKQKGEQGVRFVVACVVLALKTLHENNVMFRDLKPQNILITRDGYAKLSDFGLSKESDREKMSRTMAGSPLYLAPELVERQGYGMQIDFWTLGIFVYEMFYGQPPFQRQDIQRGRYKKICEEAEGSGRWKSLENISEAAASMITGLLKVNPKQRLGASNWDDLINHAFFEGFDWEKLQNFEMESPLKDIVTEFPKKVQRLGSMETEEQYPHIADFNFKSL